MNTAKKIKLLLVMQEMTLKELAALLQTSQPNLSNKLKRDNFSEKELREIANALDVQLDIRFTLKDGTTL